LFGLARPGAQTAHSDRSNKWLTREILEDPVKINGFLAMSDQAVEETNAHLA
jgi:hypothetical protein